MTDPANQGNRPDPHDGANPRQEANPRQRTDPHDGTDPRDGADLLAASPGDAAGDPAGDLALIRRMMEEGRARLGADGRHVTLWGIIVALGFLGTWAVVAGYLPRVSPWLWVWLPLGLIGWTVSMVIGRNTPGSSNPVGRIGDAAWLAVGLSMTVVLIAGLVGGHGPSPITVVMISAALFASAFFTIALVTKDRYLAVVPVGWWAVLGWMTQVETFTRPMLLALALISVSLITVPGLILMRCHGRRGHHGGV
ncbi:hypothetical protein [Yunchengibacter salinarum]|uniref:hypothetical protein n=1 Tax=Yunchengibacter salinarum TaxID=3133399 RepID=UPI0035B68B6C